MLDRRSSAAHLLLLCKFRRGDLVSRFHNLDYWSKALQERTEEALAFFIGERLLIRAALSEALSFKFKISDLKTMLKSKNLRIAGRKSDMINRLIENDGPSMAEAATDVDLFVLGAEGQKLADNFLSAESTRREEVEQQSLTLLQKSDFPGAVQVIADFEALQVFPRGIGIDWKNYNPAPDIESLRTIFDSRPTILGPIEDSSLKELRIGAAMMKLWGAGAVEHWIRPDVCSGLRFDLNTACRMLVFHASHLQNTQVFAASGVRTVEIFGIADDNACSACRKLSGKTFSLDQIPPLPFDRCTSELGCRCTTVATEYESGSGL